MNQAYSRLRMRELTGNLREDMYSFLVNNGCKETAEHCIRVGEESKRIAEKFGVNPTSAEYAGYLHDISAVFPNQDRISVARSLEIEVLAEEEKFPMIIHQKISKKMALDLFDIHNQEILDAVGCHTTLRKKATTLDKVLFVADKIEWDQPGTPPYITAVTKDLEHSLEHASFAYIHYLWEQRGKLRVLHPWLADAYYDLKSNLDR